MSGPREFPNAVEAWKYLQKKTATVKAQELRQRIADDIERIKSRKSNDVIIPVSRDVQEEWFAKLEGNGIWKQVLGHVKNDSDITSAYYASDTFQNHLEKKWTMMHLPQVFAVLRERKYLYFVDRQRRDDDDDDDEAEARNREVLKHRFVSKEWKKAAEERLLEPIGFSNPDWHLRGTEKSLYRIKSCPIRCKFRDVADVDLAMKAMPTADLCSSLLRIIEVEYMDNANQETFYGKIQQFLDIHGQSVWILRFIAYEEQGRYKNFWNCVSRMPNLRQMALYYAVMGDISEDEKKRLLLEYPFPTLPSLEVLLMDYVSSSDKLLVAEIMKRNLSLKSISLECEDDTSFLNDLLPVLTNLNLERFEFTVDIGALENIQPLRQLEWPLKVLNLNIESTMIASGVFGIMNQFNDSLEEISLDYIKLKDDEKSVAVHFPRLKKINKVSIEI